jgi:hypothetical protein
LPGGVGVCADDILREFTQEFAFRSSTRLVYQYESACAAGGLSGCRVQENRTDGEVVVCRECLVAGDKSGTTLEEFWERRSNFIALEYAGDPIEYQENVAYELEN